ncbi:MAG: alpha/beta fold hydrolase BchO [Pseudomonadota bacterium]
MDWSKHGANWPHGQHSRFVNSRPHRWHLQDMGTGPVMLLLHGAGGATHSFRGMMPLLAQTHRVIAVDLPGHGFTDMSRRGRSGLRPMADDLRALLASQNLSPQVLVGHSAGAAIALRLALDLPTPPRAVVSINGALRRFPGVASWLFPLMAKMLALNPLTAFAFSRTASSRQSVRNLLEGTGSRVDDEGLDLYTSLIGDRAHVDGALSMMAQWELEEVLPDLDKLPCPVLFLAGGKDRAVPAETSAALSRRLRNTTLVRWDAEGHLMHEEHPKRTVDAITAFLGQSDEMRQEARSS